MATRLIAKEEWTSFLDQCSRNYLHQRATLEAVGTDLGDQLLAQDQDFLGISADEKDQENRIAILIGPEQQPATHAADQPTELWWNEPDGAGAPSLEIKTADGDALILRFAASTTATTGS